MLSASRGLKIKFPTEEGAGRPLPAAHDELLGSEAFQLEHVVLPASRQELATWGGRAVDLLADPRLVSLSLDRGRRVAAGG
eukprot:6282298-Prymnesium_polylepis.1